MLDSMIYDMVVVDERATLRISHASGHCRAVPPPWAPDLVVATTND